MRFIKESTNVINEEIVYIESAVSSLEPSKMFTNGKEMQVKFKMMLTMVDNKVCNAATEMLYLR